MKARFLFSLILGISLSRVDAQTWTLTSAPLTNWTSVGCSADGQQIVAAAGGAPYLPAIGPICLSTNAGRTWAASTAPAIGWASVASSANGKSLIAAGSDGAAGPIYTSTNAGSSWFPNASAPSPFGWWESIACSADGSVILAGSGGAGGEAYGGQISISTNGGGTWVSTPSSGYLTCAALSSDGRTMMVGLDAANPAPLSISTNGGRNWQDATVGGAYCAGCSADGATMIATSFRRNPAGPVFVSKDSGVSWTQVTNSGVAAYTAAISSDGKTIIAAENAIVPGGESPIFVSHDSGASWSSNSFQNTSWVSVASSADGSILMAAANGGGIYTLERTPEPVLKTSVSGVNLTLSWTVPSMNFVLQQATDLTSGFWQSIAGEPILNYSNLQYQVNVPNPHGTTFYRLVSQ